MDNADTKPPVLTPMTVLLDVLNRGKKRGREEGSISTCAVCGKEHARNDKRLNTDKYPSHKLAHEGKYVERLARLNMILNGNLVDMVTRGVYNAEEDAIKRVLFMARKEHDSYVPEEKPEQTSKATVKQGVTHINEHAVTTAIREILAMMGAKADAEKDPVKLLGYVKGNISLLQNQLKEATMRR